MATAVSTTFELQLTFKPIPIHVTPFLKKTRKSILEQVLENSQA